MILTTAVDQIMKEQDDVLLVIMSHLDTTTLCSIKVVCRHWCYNLVERTIVYKLPPAGKKPFDDYKELIRVVRKYCTNKAFTAEFIASTYGWPIGKWDVSKVTKFVFIFLYMKDFNEDINEWDVSNATTFHGMFSHAIRFNQDLSKWNTGKVESMKEMFYHARNFNGNITTWDVKKVERATNMFQYATAFDQDLSKYWPGMPKNILRWKQDDGSAGRVYISDAERTQIWPTSLQL
mmetsp:Transcript_23516/g.34705  ORF Transcript_23516/g.34705 Transcript_23516/m.34705 type:complete len:235 (-) Transcript_23516:60-764(-)